VNASLKSRRVLFTVLLCAAVIASGLMSVSTVKAQAQCSPSHVVQKGENLFRIALANGTTWPILQQLNHIPNENLIFPGQVICLPGSTPGDTATPPVVTPVVTPAPPTVVPGGQIVLPPPGVFPKVDFNTRSAGPGDTITITGVSFPTNETVDIFITPTGTEYPTMPSGSAITATDGTLNTNFTIPADVGGVPLHGSSLSIMVRGRTTGFFGFNFFANPRP
jgi:LysM repeat protein